MTEAIALPQRAGHLPLGDVIDLYMGTYAGRDSMRGQRLRFWKERLGSVRFDEVTDDQIHAELEALATAPPRRWAGVDADGRPIFKAGKAPRAPATINRYSAALGAVITWAMRRRIAPKGFIHPCRSVERRTENNEHTRFLADDERTRLLDACRRSKWPKLYLLVLLALTTGARRGELLGLRWRDIDLPGRVMHVDRTKNGDPKVLPLVPSVVEQLEQFLGADSALVFASKQRPNQAYAFEQRWITALREAKVRGFRFHDCRHSCASMLARQGATLLEIGDLLGHRQVSMTKRYSHLASSHRSALVNRVLGDLR
jgi:integrase